MDAETRYQVRDKMEPIIMNSKYFIYSLYAIGCMCLAILIYIS